MDKKQIFGILGDGDIAQYMGILSGMVSDIASETTDGEEHAFTPDYVEKCSFAVAQVNEILAKLINER